MEAVSPSYKTVQELELTYVFLVDAGQSSTFVDVEPSGFNISYVDGSGSTGDYFQDTFSIGGSSIKNFEMGLALDTTIGNGIMGIGYNTSEANIETGNGTIYPNLPEALVNAGLINTNAYSLWLDDLRKYPDQICEQFQLTGK